MDKKQKEYLNKMTSLMLDSGFDLKMLDMMQGYLPKVSIRVVYSNDGGRLRKASYIA